MQSCLKRSLQRKLLTLIFTIIAQLVFYRSFSLTSRDVTTFSPAYFKQKYTEPKFGSDRAFCGLINTWARLINTCVPLWYTNMAEYIKPSFYQIGKI